MIRSATRQEQPEPVDNDPIIAPATSDGDGEGTAMGRHHYRLSDGSRWRGFGATFAVYMLVCIPAFITLSSTFVTPTPPPALTVVDMQPPAAPQDPAPRDDPEPTALEKPEILPDPLPVDPVAPEIVLEAPVTLPATPQRPADPAPQKAEPVPPAPQVSTGGPDSWEGRVLAQLNRQRRYPRLALVRRQQGVPYIRFTIDREGKVLSSQLEQSSGFRDLDEEAVRLPRRAQPLPKPPKERPGAAIELVVPVEFFLR